MDEDEALSLFGLPARGDDLPRLRALLGEETRKEAASQGRGDTDLMKLICVQLFMAGEVADCLRVWAAKKASMDADAAIDMALVLGAGLAATVAHLESLGDPAARRALAAVARYVADGDHAALSPVLTVEYWRRYYRV